MMEGADFAMIDSDRKRDVAKFRGRSAGNVVRGQITPTAQYYLCEVEEVRRVHIVRAKTRNHVFEALSTMLPLISPHEGVWRITTYGDHFTVTSSEAMTIGPFAWIERVQLELDVFGLELRIVSGGLKGFAHFEVLSAGCLADAIDRLYWLEHVCWRINKAIGNYSGELWLASFEEIGRKGPALENADEVVNPLPLCPELQPRRISKNYA